MSNFASIFCNLERIVLFGNNVLLEMKKRNNNIGMKKTLLGFSLVASVLLLQGCSSDDNPINSDSGRINPLISLNSDVYNEGTPQGRGGSTPTVSDLKLALTSSNGSYKKTWSSVDLFPTEEAFKVGDYKMEAYLGSIDDEGFEKPYYYGSMDFTVYEDRTTDVDIVATLANTMVSIEYTDAFKSYFSSYSAELHSEGGNYVKYFSDETRPAYLRPGNISLSITVTKPNGATATFQPATISAKARHHYRITLDVNGGEVGAGTLVISFDETLQTETIKIELSDELMNAPAPTVTSEGFTHGTNLTLFEGSMPDEQVRYLITARGGLSSVTLTTKSQSLIEQGWPAEVDLMQATEMQKSRFESLGLKVAGLWKNPDQMAIVDFTNALSNIKYVEGDALSTFTIVVKDKMTKVCEPVTLSVLTSPIDLSILSVSVAEIGVDEAELKIAYNGEDFDNKVKIEIRNSYGVWESAKVLSVDASADYTVKIAVPAGNMELPVRVLYNGDVKAEDVILRSMPEYAVSVDAFSGKAYIKLTPADESLLAAVVSNCSVYLNDAKVTVSSRDASSGILEVEELTPATTYVLKTTLLQSAGDGDYSEPIEFTTESHLPVPNGNFEDIKTVIDNLTINCGGIYYETKISINPYQNTQAFNVSAPTGWATVNAKTFCTSASHQNTWYMQPSSMVVSDAVQNGNYAMKLINVAWDTNGPSIPKYNFTWGKAESNWGASQNKPSSIAYRAAGKLFLGTYAFDAATNSETYNEGVSFTSRPSALNGFYKYTASANPSDYGIVIVDVLGVSGEVIAFGTASLVAKGDYTAFTVPLTYNQFGVKAAKIKIMFASSASVGLIAEETASIVTSDDLKTASSLGNALWIDNLTFSY